MSMRCNRVRRARPLLGTRVEIALSGGSEARLHHAATAAFEEIARVHQLMSLHSSDSDLYRINNAPVASVVRVDALTWQVLELAVEMAEASGGVFDVSVGGEMMARGDLPLRIRNSPDPDATYRDIELLPQYCVRLRRALAVDVGGIAKGYAVDRAVTVLRELGVDGGCVNAGGDLRAFGDEPVTVHVRDPNEPSRARAQVTLHERALATSGNYASAAQFSAAGVVLDGRNRQSASGGRCASVRASSCASADALAKCVLLLGTNSKPLLHRYHADGFIIDGETSMAIDAAADAMDRAQVDASRIACGYAARQQPADGPRRDGAIA